MSEPTKAVFELDGEVSVVSRGIAVVECLDDTGEPSIDISNIGDLDEFTALGLLEGAAATYRQRIVEGTENKE